MLYYNQLQLIRKIINPMVNKTRQTNIQQSVSYSEIDVSLSSEQQSKLSQKYVEISGDLYHISVQSQEKSTLHQDSGQGKIKIYVFLVLLIVCAILSGHILYQLQLEQMNMIDTSKLISPPKIFEIQKLKEIKQLPFCLLVIPSQKYTKDAIQVSIKQQKYGNYVVVSVPIQGNYYFYKKQIRQKCIANSVVMFITGQLQTGALLYMNQILQEYRAWVLYTESVENGGLVEVVGFYERIYELLEKNDFDKKNVQFLQQNNRRIQALSMLELCQQSSKKVQKQKIFKSQTQPTYFSLDPKIKTSYIRTNYNKIYRLSQDTQQFNSLNFQKKRSLIITTHDPLKVHPRFKNIYRAVDRQQVWYLPHNHSISQLQFNQYSAKYKINNYIGDIRKQVRFCVTVLSRNNIQSDRYLKVLKSITQQQYQNYHIVFIDDLSTDTTLTLTSQYLSSINFPKSRLTFIKNLQRNYATYNIMNSAFNYCHEDDIQLLVDGDDQIIGRYAFQVMNSVYQREPGLWVVYSNYKTNYMGIGRSWIIPNQSMHIDGKTGKRMHHSFLGPIRTWRVKLLYNIPLIYHKMQNGQWLDTGYDDAITNPLLQLASLKRISFITLILYQYNVDYGDNDDSSKQKIEHRLDLYSYLDALPILGRIQSLEGSVRNGEVWQELKQGYDKRYTLYKGE